MWLGKNVETNEKIAIKQFAKGKGYKSKADVESCYVEIKVGKMLFGENGVPSDDAEKFPGVKNIAGFINCINDSKDLWIAYEVGGTSLTKLLFDVKGIIFIH